MHLAFQLSHTSHAQTAIHLALVIFLLRSVDFEANVEATCMQAGVFRTKNSDSFFNYPCTDFEGFLSGKKDFTATVVRVDPYTGSPKQKAYITLAGAPAASSS